MRNFDLETVVSLFDYIKATTNPHDITVSQALDMIKDGDFKDEVEELRRLGSGEEYDRIKQTELAAVSLHAYFTGRRKKENIARMSGLIIVDIDDVEPKDLENFKDDIMLTMSSVLAAMVSPSGDGIKCLYLVDDSELTIDNYRLYGREVAMKFQQYGKTDVLSLTDCLIMTYDPEIKINENAAPDSFIKIKEEKIEKKELGYRDKSIPLFEVAEDFYYTVLFEEIRERADNNFHFIQMSVLELAKYGMVEDQDLDFIISESESLFKRSKENPKRLKEAIEEADNYEQTKWAYDYSAKEDRDVGMSVERKLNDEGIPEELEDVSIDDYEELGIVDYNTMYEEVEKVLYLGDRDGAEISLSNFADVFRWKVGLTVITGIPSHGKTEWLDQNIVDLARIHGWKTAVAGFEQTEAEHILKLVRKVVGFDIRSDGADKSELKNAYQFVVDHVKHVDVEKTGGNIDSILKVFEDLYYLYGIKNFVIDPFNLLSVKGKVGGHEKAEEIVRRMVLFCKRFGVSIMLIAHPTKMQKKEGSSFFEVPDLYSVKGTSAFYEMAYHGMVVYRYEKGQNNDGISVMVRILKVKQNNLGKRGGEAYFRYDIGSGRYIPVDNEGMNIDGDHKEKNWHLKI